MKAWTTVGAVWPTLRVPGMSRSGTTFQNRNIDVVVAKDPMPRVSKKFVMKPMPRCNGVGAPRSTAGSSAGSRRRARPMKTTQPVR